MGPEVKKPFRPASSRRRRAFTIAEVMMATAVMAMAISTSITTMQRGFLSLDSARNTTLAGQIMQSELEKMRLKDWTTVSAYPAGPTAITIDSTFTSNSAIGNRFTLTRSVEEVASHSGEMKKITFTITWRGYDGRQITRYYVTYYARNGLYDYFYNST